MIYVTGDTHGKFDRVLEFCKRKKTRKKDILIILGDTGINYYLGKKNKLIKEVLNRLPITLFCIHGNHEQRPNTINTYVEMEWRGGKVYVEKEYPSILFAKDGEIYNFDGKRAIAIGGAYSVDKFYRLANHYMWFEDEQPSEEIKRFVEQNLDLAGWKVDYVLSHTVPLKYEPVEMFLPGIDQSTVDKSTEIWLGEIEEKLEYERWYCGHYHTEKKVDKVEIMYENIGKIGME